MAKDLLIIAGHGKGYWGSYDPGATSKWGQEADYTRELATMVKASIGSLLDVDMYDQDKDCYSYSANGQVPDYAAYKYVLEIHFNAKTDKDPSGDGAFTGCGGYYHPYNADRDFADNLVQAIAELGFKVWGNFTSTGLLNLNNAQAAGVKYFLLETAFIDDGDDMAWYTAHKKEVAQTIAQKYIDEIKGKGTAQQPEESIKYYARKSWADKESQFNAYADLSVAKANCPAGYTVYDKTGKALYTNSAVVTGTQTSEFAGLSETAAAERLLEICKPIAEKNDLFPSVCAAQTILESGYCTTELAKKANNVCGMKANLSGNTWPGSTWDGKGKVKITTAEQDESGKVCHVKADFRAYPCIEDSITDRCAYLLGAQNGNKLRYEGIRDCQSYREQIELIKAGGYATDVAYVDKICNIIERFGLDKYDQVTNKPQELPGNDLLSTLLKFQERLQKDIGSGRKWIYSNSGCSSTITTALKKDNRKCNCALLVRWALRKLGLLNDDNWWGEQGGMIVWRGTSKEQILKYFDLIHIGGKKTVNQAIKDGTLQAGDIVTYVKMQHTNVYAGNGKWYDAGHAYASGSGDGAVFKSWYGNTVHGAQPIGYILRRKGAGQPEQPEQKLHIVREGMYIKKDNADRRCMELINAGFSCVVKKVDDMWWTQCGAFEELENAQEKVRQLKNAGFDAVIK